MEEENRKEDLENLHLFFKKIIGGEVEFVDKKIESNEDIFVDLLDKLEQSIETQNLIFMHGEISVEKIVEPLWYVLESFMMLNWGEEGYGLVMWYLFDRWDEEGNVIEWEDLDGKTYKIDSKKELWKFIEYNFIN